MLQLARMIHFDSTRPRSPATIALVVVVPNNLCEWHLEGGFSWNLLVGLVDPLVAISWKRNTWLFCFSLIDSFFWGNDICLFAKATCMDGEMWP